MVPVFNQEFMKSYSPMNGRSKGNVSKATWSKNSTVILKIGLCYYFHLIVTIDADSWFHYKQENGWRLDDMLSTDGTSPHFPVDSRGSMTTTPPSVNAKANWFASCGWAAIATGYALELQSLYIRYLVIKHRKEKWHRML